MVQFSLKRLMLGVAVCAVTCTMWRYLLVTEHTSQWPMSVSIPYFGLACTGFGISAGILFRSFWVGAVVTALFVIALVSIGS